LASFLVLAVSFSQAIEEVNDIVSGVENSTRIVNASFDTLYKGKNLVVFDDYINVQDLVLKNPKIETVSYYDSFNQESVGYINFLGGIGKDFVIIPGNQYEIFVKSQINLNLQ
jgi:hypothetical protein